MTMIKKFLLILLLGLFVQGCTIGQVFQRFSQAEARAHDFAVQILDDRKADRGEIRRLRQNHVRNLDSRARQLVTEGKTADAAKLRDEAIAYIESHTPSVIDSIQHIRQIWRAVKGDFKE